jgi:hypothetical protein
VIALRSSGARGRVFHNALLVVVAAVILWRAASLAGGKPVLTARSEKEFFGWSYRDTGLRAKLEEAAARLRPNEAIAIEVPAGDYDAAWIEVMARYYFARQRIRHRIEPSPADPRSATRVIIRRDGPVRIVRIGESPSR